HRRRVEVLVLRGAGLRARRNRTAGAVGCLVLQAGTALVDTLVGEEVLALRGAALRARRNGTARSGGRVVLLASAALVHALHRGRVEARVLLGAGLDRRDDLDRQVRVVLDRRYRTARSVRRLVLLAGAALVYAHHRGCVEVLVLRGAGLDRRHDLDRQVRV